MKIALLTPQFAPRFQGGTEAVARAQGRGLAALGHDVVVISGTDRPLAGQEVEREEVDGLPVAFLARGPDEPYDLALDRPRLERLVSELVADRDVVHVHHWSTLSGALVRTLAPRVPVVVTLHDLFATCARFFRVPHPAVEGCPGPGEHEPCARCLAPDAPGVAPGDLLEGVRARAAAFRAELEAAAALLAPSRAHAARVADLTGIEAGRVAVLPHGLCADMARPRCATCLAWTGEGRLRVLFLGHRAQVKGVHDLARALVALPPDERARVELVCLGGAVEPGVDATLERAARGVDLRLEDGYDLAELPRRLAELGGAHLCAFPSRVEESYGLVVDEAHALGLPVWVTERGAPRERVGAAGRVLPAADPGAWTAALREVIVSPASLAAERAAVPATVRTARDAARELEALYEGILARQT